VSDAYCMYGQSISPSLSPNASMYVSKTDIPTNVLLTKKTITGVRRESTTLLPLWQTSHRQQMELCRYSCRCLSWNVHNLYPSPSCRIRWFIPSFAVVLAFPGCFRYHPACMGFAQGDYAA
jgi:hypothetical protein